MKEPVVAAFNRNSVSASFAFDFGAGLRFHLDERTTARRAIDCQLNVPLTSRKPPTDLEQIVVQANLPAGPIEEALAPKPCLTWSHAWNGLDAQGQPYLGSLRVPVKVGWQRAQRRALPKRTQWWDKPALLAGWDARSLPFGGLLPRGFWHLEIEAEVLWGAQGERVQEFDLYLGEDLAKLGLGWVPAWPNDLVVVRKTQILVFSPTGQLHISLNRATGDELFRMFYNEHGQPTGWQVEGSAPFQLSQEGNQTTVTAPNGHSVTFTLDENLRLENALTSSQATFGCQFEPSGLISEITDPVGLAVEVRHDELGRATTLSWSTGKREDLVVTNERGVETTRVITAGGRELSRARRSLPGETTETASKCCGSSASTIMLRSPGQTTITTADGTRIHRVHSTTATKDGEIEEERTTTRTPAGRTSVELRQRKTLADGTVEDTLMRGIHKWTQALNATTGVATSTTPSGLITRVQYREDGTKVWQRPDAGTVTTEYVDGKLVRTSRGGSSTSHTYDENGWLKTVTQAGVVRQFNYNAAGDVVAEYNGEGWLQLERDPAGRVVATTTPRGDTTQITLDPDGAVTAIERPTEAGVVAERFTYDADRQLLSSQVEGEAEITYTRAVSGQIERITAGESKITAKLDPRSGQVTHAETEAGNSTSLTYDGALVTAEEVAGQVSGRIEVEYDDNFSVASRTVLGMSLRVERDSDGKVVVNGPVRFVRSAETGQVVSVLAGGLVTNYQYDATGALVYSLTTFGDRVVFGESITRDDEGRIVGVEEAAAAGSSTIAYGYDVLGRFVSATKDQAPELGLAYDQNDNIIAYGRTSGLVEVEVGAGDRIKKMDGDHEVVYSPAGRVLRLAGREFAYDGFGHLVGVTTASGDQVGFVRDANHHVIEITEGNETRFQLLRHLGRVAAVVRRDGAALRVVESPTTEAPAALVSETQVLVLVTDHRGNVRLAVDANTGEVMQSLTYGPLGDVVADSNPGFQPFGYAGGVHYPLAKVVQLGARDLDVVTSRFLQPDPLELAGGQTNLYAYAANDPVNRHDPGGLQSSAKGPVSVCRTTIGGSGKSKWNSIDHAYLKWGDTRRGMDARAGQWNPYTNTPYTEWRDEGNLDAKQQNEECREVENVDVECLDNYTKPGTGEGLYGPGNLCWDVVYEALDACGNWKWKESVKTDWPISSAYEITSRWKRWVKSGAESAAEAWIRYTE